MRRTRLNRTVPTKTNGDGSNANGPKPTSPRTLILPSGRSHESRIISLENPRSGQSENFFLCPVLGLFEFTVVKAPSSQPRSILFTSPREKSIDDQTGSGEDKDQSGKYSSSSVSKTAQLYVATPVDVLFFVLPILSPPDRSQGRSRNLFQPIDDIIDSNDSLSKALKSTLLGPLRLHVEARMKAICDTVEAGDGLMFRLNEQRLVEQLLHKAERVSSEKGLPPSMEEHFVRRALELPFLSIERDDVVTATRNGGNEQDSSSSASATATPQTDATTSNQKTSSASESPVTLDEQSEASSQIPGYNAPNEIVRLLRIRIALSFIMSLYVPKQISTLVEEVISSPETPLDFNPLQDQLKYVADQRSKAQAARSTDNFNRKRRLLNDETADMTAEKRRKTELEKKEKAAQSKGVRDLKKADTGGMKKLSLFFIQKGPQKKT